jgi:hypothetical protein
VNDVKDIYDEKTTEEVLKNPEQWVRDTLAGPEKRIILVCSRLAYECLSTVKRGISRCLSYQKLQLFVITNICNLNFYIFVTFN